MHFTIVMMVVLLRTIGCRWRRKAVLGRCVVLVVWLAICWVLGHVGWGKLLVLEWLWWVLGIWGLWLV
jgi:hypothetical protein